MRSLVAIFFLALALPLPAWATTEASKTVHDWAAYCDNLRACSAFGYVTTLDEEFLGAWLTIARSGEAEAVPTVLIGITLASDTPPAGTTFTIAFDDPTITALPGPLAATEGDVGAVTASLPAASVPAFLAGLRKASALKLTMKGADGAAKVTTISLAGATGTLLWIDETQKRLDTVTALIRTGPKPATAVPPPPAMPIIVAAKPVAGPLPKAPSTAEQKKLLGPDCESNLDPIDPIIGRLDAHRVLFGLFCDAGAYNYDYNFFVATDGGTPKPITLNIPKWIDSDGSSTTLVNPDFDATTLELTSFAKGRGIGDCGSMGNWVWDGTTFQLTSYQSLDACNGVPSEFWPVLYRAEIR